MAKKQRRLHSRFKLWISSAEDEGVFGDGKWRLLQAIEKRGSLTAASRSLKMSYRKAWGDLEKAERCLGRKLIERRRGGPGGGETVLTETGKRWLAAYSKFRSDMERTASRAFDSRIRPLLRK